MKKVRLSVVHTIEGKSFHIPETDGDGQAVLEDGKPKMREASIKDLIRIMVFNLPPDKISMADSISAHRVMEQMAHASDGVLSLEEAEHDWLKKRTDDFGPRVFGVNAVMVKLALDDFERAHISESK